MPFYRNNLKLDILKIYYANQTIDNPFGTWLRHGLGRCAAARTEKEKASANRQCIAVETKAKASGEAEATVEACSKA